MVTTNLPAKLVVIAHPLFVEKDPPAIQQGSATAVRKGAHQASRRPPTPLARASKMSMRSPLGHRALRGTVNVYSHKVHFLFALGITALGGFKFKAAQWPLSQVTCRKPLYITRKRVKGANINRNKQRWETEKSLAAFKPVSPAVYEVSCIPGFLVCEQTNISVW